MNYIKKLEETVATLQDALHDADGALQEVYAYLNSSKFYSPDDYVYVRDILARLAPVRSAVIIAK